MKKTLVVKDVDMTVPMLTIEGLKVLGDKVETKTLHGTTLPRDFPYLFLSHCWWVPLASTSSPLVVSKVARKFVSAIYWSFLFSSCSIDMVLMMLS